MLEYDRIDVSECIDVNKTSSSRELAYVIIIISKVFVRWLSRYVYNSG